MKRLAWQQMRGHTPQCTVNDRAYHLPESHIIVTGCGLADVFTTFSRRDEQMHLPPTTPWFFQDYLNKNSVAHTFPILNGWNVISHTLHTSLLTAIWKIYRFDMCRKWPITSWLCRKMERPRSWWRNLQQSQLNGNGQLLAGMRETFASWRLGWACSIEPVWVHWWCCRMQKTVSEKNWDR